MPEAESGLLRSLVCLAIPEKIYDSSRFRSSVFLKMKAATELLIDGGISKI
jgi:hypothetical protein